MDTRTWSSCSCTMQLGLYKYVRLSVTGNAICYSAVLAWLLYRIVCHGRWGKANRVRCVGPLSGWHQSISNGRRRLPDVVDVSVARRRLRAGQALSTSRFTKSQLHGAASRLRVVAVSHGQQRRRRRRRSWTINRRHHGRHAVFAAANAIMWCPSVCLSPCHVRKFCQNK